MDRTTRPQMSPINARPKILDRDPRLDQPTLDQRDPTPRPTPTGVTYLDKSRTVNDYATKQVYRCANFALMTSLTGRIPGMPPEFGTTVGFVKASLTDVADEMFAWQAELSFDPIRVEFSGGILQNATTLLPIATYPARRDLLIATAGAEYTAIFNSFINGGDPMGPAMVLSQRLDTSFVVATSIPFQGEAGSIPHMLGGLQLTYGSSGESGFKRSISLVEGESTSSRYYFEALGPEQPWENTNAYASRRKRDRFTPEMLREYCIALGIDVFEVAFYSGPACLIERTKV